MSKTKVDYSELVDALQSQNDQRADELLAELMPRLQDYLMVVMNAERNAARECVQQAFLDVYEQILKDKIKHNKYIFSYLIKSCRHEYIRYAKQQHRFTYDDDIFYDMAEPQQQIENLLEEERLKILEECLEELKEKSKKFIKYFIDKPEASTADAQKKFGLSSANVRTKKSRILSRLHHCYKRKSNL